MKVSKNWLAQYVDLSTFQSAQDIADLLTGLGLEVEGVDDQSLGFDRVITAQVVVKNPHPNADRLSLCEVDPGTGKHLSIVCGAKNFKQGDVVCLAQVGAKLPVGLKIKKGKIRGSVSEGMLCSEEELGLSDSSDGILVLPKDTPLGRPVSDILGRNDTVFEISLTPNRGDCLSHLGVAREIAAKLGTSVCIPDVEILNFSNSPIKTALNAKDQADAFYGVAIDDVKVGPSPDWLKQRLESIGARSINNIVDATNFVMFECGQPQHAYDLKKLSGKTLEVRPAKAKEKLTLLDERDVTLDGGELVISDESKAVALAGVMGGKNSEVSEETTSVFLECAHFHSVSVRQTASKFHQHSDASHRFERGVDLHQLPWAISRLAHLIIELAGGNLRGGTFAKREEARSWNARVIEVSPNEFNEFLGFSLKKDEIKSLLEKLQFRVEESSLWRVTVPSYRHDIQIKEDLADEIARMVGYDQLEGSIPKLSEAPHSKQSSEHAQAMRLAEHAKDILSALGFNECIHYGFGSMVWQKKLGFQPSVKVSNPMSEDQEVMVTSLIPHLVESVRLNWNRHFGSQPQSIRLFEIRPTFELSSSDKKVVAKSRTETTIKESWKLALVLSGLRDAQNLKIDARRVDFYDLKGAIEVLLDELGVENARILPAPVETTEPFHPGKTAMLQVRGQSIGFFGEWHPRLAQKLKAKDSLFLAEFDWEAIAKASKALGENRVFQKWSEHPSVERDFALMVKREVLADEITRIAKSSGKPLVQSAQIFDIYEGKQVPEGMTSIAVRVIFSDEERSLKEKEVDLASEAILSQWKKKLGAQLR